MEPGRGQVAPPGAYLTERLMSGVLKRGLKLLSAITGQSRGDAGEVHPALVEWPGPIFFSASSRLTRWAAPAAAPGCGSSRRSRIRKWRVAATDPLTPAATRPRANANRRRPTCAASLESSQEGACPPRRRLVVRNVHIGGGEKAS